MDKERLQYIDNLKAFAIILVVVGHVIQYFLCPDDYSQNVVFKYIYAFHMQLFIFLSGVTFSNRITDKVELYHKLGRRAKQLLLPFISWTVIGSLMTHNPYSVLTNILHPGYGLWFIWDLFFIYAYMSIAIHIGRKSKLRMGGGYYYRIHNCIFDRCFGK